MDQMIRKFRIALDYYCDELCIVVHCKNSLNDFKYVQYINQIMPMASAVVNYLK